MESSDDELLDIKKFKREQDNSHETSLVEEIEPSTSRHGGQTKKTKSQESPSTSKQTKETEGKKKYRRLAGETPEARELRLKKERERAAEKRRNESEEARKQRREQQREYIRKVRNAAKSASDSSLSWVSAENKKKKKTVKKKAEFIDRDSNFCRFCLDNNGERDIPSEFVKVYENYYRNRFDRSTTYPQQICASCHHKSNEFLRFINLVKESQPKVGKILQELQHNSEKEQLLEVEIDSAAVTSQQNDPMDERIALQPVKTEWLSDDDFNSFQPEDDFDTMNDDDDDDKKASFPLMTNSTFAEPVIPIKLEKQSVEVFTAAQPIKPKRRVVKTTKFNSANPNRYKPGKRTCDLCGFEYNTRAGIKKHIENEHIKKNLPADRPFKCHECILTFTSNWLRWKHKSEVHFDQSKFICKVCGKQHKDTNQLRKHTLAKHSPKVICTFCAEFINQGAMTLHISNKHKMYDCEYCGQSFEGRIAQMNHVQNTHGKGPHFCPHCQTVFNNIRHLKSHIKDVHGEEKLQCLVEGCSFVTHTRGRMKYHLTYHKNIDESLRERLLAEIDLFRRMAAGGGAVQQIQHSSMMNMRNY